MQGPRRGAPGRARPQRRLAPRAPSPGSPRRGAAAARCLRDAACPAGGRGAGPRPASDSLGRAPRIRPGSGRPPSSAAGPPGRASGRWRPRWSPRLSHLSGLRSCPTCPEALAGLSPPTAARLSRGGGGVSRLQKRPPHAPHTCLHAPAPTLGKRTPPIQTGTPSSNPPLSAGPATHTEIYKRGVPGCPSRGPQALPRRPPPAPGAPRPPRPRLAPAPAGRACLSALPPLRVNINQELLRSRTALKVPPGTVLPWLRDLGGSHVRETDRRGAEGRPARGRGTRAPRAEAGCWCEAWGQRGNRSPRSAELLWPGKRSPPYPFAPALPFTPSPPPPPRPLEPGKKRGREWVTRRAPGSTPHRPPAFSRDICGVRDTILARLSPPHPHVGCPSPVLLCWEWEWPLPKGKKVFVFVSFV